MKTDKVTVATCYGVPIASLLGLQYLHVECQF